MSAASPPATIAGDSSLPPPAALGADRSGIAARRWSASRWGGVGGVGGWGLVILCLSVYLPGLWTIPPVDRDESRFAQASRQMYESGDWVIPRIQDKPRLNKPPLIYWLQCASVAVFGDKPGQYAHGNIWVFRVPSVLAAIGAVLLTWRLGLRLFDPRAAWLGAAMLAVCPMVVWDAHQARADQLLLFTTTATLFALYVIWSNSPSQREGAGGRVHGAGAVRSHGDQGLPKEPPPPPPAGEVIWGGRAKRESEGVRVVSPRPLLFPPLLFWLALSAGILTKGPITPMIAALTALALCLTTRRWRWLLDLRPILGLLILVAAVSPWLFALTHRLGHPTSEFRHEMQQHGLTLGTGESGWMVYARIVYDETLGRSAAAKEGHWGPPGYHLVLLTVLFWPGSLLTGLALARAFRRAFPFGCHHPPKGRVAAGFPSRIKSLLSLLRSPNFDPPSRFLLCWIIPSWLVFELISTKLPHYTMPLYPALALLSGRAVFAAHRGVLKGLRDLGTRIGFAIWWLVGLAATLGLSILVIIAGRVDQSSSILAALKPYALPGVVIAIALLASGRSLVRGFYFRAQMLSLVAVVLWGATLLQFILPGAQRFWVSSRIAATIDISKLHTPYWSMGNASGFNEDSLVFLVRGEPMGGSVPSIDDPKFNCDWMALATGSVDAQAWLASPRVRVADRVRGWNYSNGKPVDIIIFDRGRLKP